MKKKLLSVLLSAMLCAGMMPAGITASAVQSSPSTMGQINSESSIVDPCEWAIPQNLKVRVNSIPLDNDGNVTDGMMSLTAFFEVDQRVEEAEFFGYCDTADGQMSASVAGPLTTCKPEPGSGQQGGVFWTPDSDSGYSYDFEVPALGKNSTQSVMESYGEKYINGAAENDTVTITAAGVAVTEGNYVMTDECKGVSFTVIKDSIGKTFPLITEPEPTVGSSEAPQLTGAVYDLESEALTATFYTNDTVSRYYEAYILTDKDLENSMGSFTVGDKEYNTWAIQSFNADDTAHVTVSSQGSYSRVRLEQEMYFGNNPPLEVGDTCFVAVQTEGEHTAGTWGEGSKLSNLWTLTVAPPEVEPLPVTGVKATLISIEPGTMTTEFGDQLNGDIATVSVTFNKQEGIPAYFFSPVKPDGDSFLKVENGNMPFIESNDSNVFGWIGSEGTVTVGPNDEKLTETETTITAEIKVVKYDTEPEYSHMGYGANEKMTIGLASENPKIPKSSEFVYVEIPLKESNIGKTFVPASECTEHDNYEQRYVDNGNGTHNKVCGNCGTVLEENLPHNTLMVGDAINDAGEHIITEVCTDNCGYEKQYKYSPLNNESTINKTEIIVGETVRIKGAASGGAEDKSYEFYFKRDTGVTWKNIGQGNSAAFTPTSAGVFNVKTIAKDSTGITAEKTFTITAKNEPVFTNTTSVNSDVIKTGNKIKIKSSAENGNGPYTFELFFRRKGNTTFKNLTITDEGIASIKPTSEGVLEFKSKATDSTGAVSEKIFEVAVYDTLPLTNISVISTPLKVKAGTTVNIFGKTTGSTSPVSYKFSVKRSSNTEYLELKSRGENGSYAKFTPTASTSFDIKITATDNSGVKAEKIITIQVLK